MKAISLLLFIALFVSFAIMSVMCSGWLKLFFVLDSAISSLVILLSIIEYKKTKH